MNNQNNEPEMIQNPNQGILFNLNQDNNQNDNENINSDSFIYRLNGDEIYKISANFFPSSLFSILLILSLIFTSSYCDNGFAIALKLMLTVHILLIIESITHLIFIFIKKQNTDLNKIILSTANLSLTVLYYAGSIFSMVIYANKAETCFDNNTLLTCVLFTIVTVGFIGLSKYVLYIILFSIIFPILIDYYFNNAGKFHYTFGFTNDMMSQLPVTKAEEIHVSDCTICQDKIDIGNEIMILRCTGRHYFHSHCIKEWLMVKFCCPLCKSYNIL